MPLSLTSGILKAVKALLSPQIIDNRLNPYYLAVATRAYWIQSHILRIPDRFGFFSPGPPRLQVLEERPVPTLLGPIVALAVATITSL
ncbi:hypothetical protein DL770_009032 [Monosporascus sp. CRB-9-2]|nr:hypothetical protein DL770_009032 [Monosporascus sp. CRB-9-2]